MDELVYLQKQKEKKEKYEARCTRCGACCGAYSGDPCTNLVKDSETKYHCKDYENRIGQQYTISGKPFTCVPIRDVFRYESPYPNCAYFIK